MCLRGKNALGCTFWIWLFLRDRAYRKNNKHKVKLDNFVLLSKVKIHKLSANSPTSFRGIKLNKNSGLWSVSKQTVSTCAGK